MDIIPWKKCSMSSVSVAGQEEHRRQGIRADLGDDLCSSTNKYNKYSLNKSQQETRECVTLFVKRRFGSSIVLLYPIIG